MVLSAIESEKKHSPSRPDSAYALLLMSIGKFNYEMGDYLSAAEYYRQSIQMINSNADKPWMNPNMAIVSYYRLNVIYDSLHHVSDEMRALDSCISIAVRRKINNLYNLAALYKKTEYLFNIGDYSICISYATKCEVLGKQYALSRGKNEYDVGMQYAYSSLIWNVLAQIELNNFLIADSLLNKKLDELKKAGNLFNLASIIEQLGRVQLGMGNFKEAIAYYNKALVIQNNSGRIISCKVIYNNIGYIYFKNYRDIDRAIYYYRKALSLINRDEEQAELNSVETLNILCNVGNAYAEISLYDSAFAYFQFALDQIKPGMKAAELLHSSYDQFARQKKMDYISNLLLDKADALLKQYKQEKKLDVIEEAVRIYKITDQLLDRIKTEQSDVQSKLFWRTDSRRLYEHAIEACYAYHNMADAFYFFEKSRAVLLNDQLNEQRWLGEGDIQKQTQVKRAIQQLIKASEGLDKDSDKYKAIQEQLFNAKQELEHLVKLIKERDPLYYQSFIDSNVTTIQDVYKNILTDHQALVEIFSGDSAAYVFVVSSSRTDFTKLDKPIFDSLSKSYMKYISNPSRLNTHFDEFTRVSRKLYQFIFKNIKLPAGRIIISPDGQYFPFEALVTSNTGQPLKYFLNDYVVSYTYSAKYLMNPFNNQTDSKTPVFLGIAPVTYPASMQLATLQGSDLSLARVKSYFNYASNLVFADATKAGFMNHYSKYKVIQLYTHADASGRNNEPVIYFADSTLNLSDLLGEDKPLTQLIVLSACESGTGKLFKGEGVFSLNRGFAALGIPSSISNLWTVDDQSTYRLTELFYKYLARNMAVDLALQKAKIEFIKTASKENQLPYYWAASILIGPSNALALEKIKPWNTLVLEALVLVILALLVYAGMRQKKKG